MLGRWWHRAWGWKLLYWLRSHTFTRYHIVDCRTPEYRWGWIDRDNLMYNACFNILIDFVENEDPTVGLRTMENYEYEGMDDFARQAIELQLKDEREVRELYDWWKHGRAEEREMCSSLLVDVDTSFDKMFAKRDTGHEFVGTDDPRWRIWSAEHDRLEKKDEEMLQRLINIRGRLWT